MLFFYNGSICLSLTKLESSLHYPDPAWPHYYNRGEDDSFADYYCSRAAHDIHIAVGFSNVSHTLFTTLMTDKAQSLRQTAVGIF